MLSKRPRVLIAVLSAGVITTLVGSAAIGFGAALFYTQRQMTDIVNSQQSSEQRHSLEVKNARLEERATCEARISIANTTNSQRDADIAAQKKQIDSLVQSVARLSFLTQQRAKTGDTIVTKVDKLAKKVDETTIIAAPPTVGAQRAAEVNKKVDETNRGSK